MIEAIARFMKVYEHLCPDWDHEVDISRFASLLDWPIDFTETVAEECRARRLIDTAEGCGEPIRTIEGRRPPR